VVISEAKADFDCYTELIATTEYVTCYEQASYTAYQHDNSDCM